MSWWDEGVTRRQLAWVVVGIVAFVLLSANYQYDKIAGKVDGLKGSVDVLIPLLKYEKPREEGRSHADK